MAYLNVVLIFPQVFNKNILRRSNPQVGMSVPVNDEEFLSSSDDDEDIEATAGKTYLFQSENAFLYHSHSFHRKRT